MPSSTWEYTCNVIAGFLCLRRIETLVTGDVAAANAGTFLN